MTRNTKFPKIKAVVWQRIARIFVMFWMFHIYICSNPKLKVLNIKYELGTKNSALRSVFVSMGIY